MARVYDSPQARHWCVVITLAMIPQVAKAAAPNRDQLLMDWNHTWKYLVPLGYDDGPDNEVNPEYVFTEEWFNPDFNDEIPVRVPQDSGDITLLHWRQAPGPFQRGGVDGLTQFEPTYPAHKIEPLPDAGSRFSVYFRSTFNVATPISNVVFDAVIDDAAVVFIDGEEVPQLRSAPERGRLPLWTDSASSSGFEGLRHYNVTFARPLGTGQHSIAIIVHNSGPSSADQGMGLRAISAGRGTLLWTADRSADWHDSTNWRYGDVPLSQSEFAVFGNANTTEQTIWNDLHVPLDGIQFDSNSRYNIGGRGSITLQGNVRNGSLNAVRGSHELQLPIRLGIDADVHILRSTESGVDAAITLRNEFDLAGHTATLTGGGELRVMNRADTGSSGRLHIVEGSLAGDGVLHASLVVGPSGVVYPTGRSAASMAEGRPSTLTVSDGARFSNGSTLTLNLYGNELSDKLNVRGDLKISEETTIEISLAPGFAPVPGDTFHVLEWDSITTPFSRPILPALSDGRYWDLRQLWTQGQLSVIDANSFQPCDFDGDGFCNTSDLNSLTSVGNLVTGVREGDPAYQPKYDINADISIDSADMSLWLADAAARNGWAHPYFRGDTNLDGKVDFTDFVNLNNHWQQSELGDGMSVAWSDGDFDGDGFVGFSDFVVQNNNWLRMNAADAQIRQVPEPTGLALFTISLVFASIARRRTLRRTSAARSPASEISRQERN